MLQKWNHFDTNPEPSTATLWRSSRQHVRPLGFFQSVMPTKETAPVVHRLRLPISAVTLDLLGIGDGMQRQLLTAAVARIAQLGTW